MNENKARQLANQFFEGTTTLHEEQELYVYFKFGHVSPELMPLRQMFLDMCQLQGCEPQPKAQMVSIKNRRRWRRIAAAAAVVASVGIVTSMWFAQADDANYEMVAYGQRQNDREAVMREVGRTLGEAQNNVPDIGAELKDAFGQQ